MNVKKIVLEINANYGKIQSFIPYDLKQKLYAQLSYQIHGFRFTKAHKEFGWDGYRSLYKSKTNTFPAGVYNRVRDILNKEGYSVDITFVNDYKPLGDGSVYEIDLYDFQLQAVEKAINSRIGIIDIPVRGGKTAIIASILSRIRQYPAIIITFGSDLVLQTKQELERFLKCEVGYFYKSMLDTKDILVTDFQAIRKIITDCKSTKERNKELQKFVNKTKVLLIDECHYAYTIKSKKVLDLFTSVGYKIGLSGTPKPDNTHKLELEEYIGPVIHKIGFDKLIDIGRIVQPVVYMYDLPNAWYTGYLNDFSEYYESNIVQNEKRNEFICKLTKDLQAEGKTIFIVVSKRYHGELLTNMIEKSVYVHGDIDSDIRKELYTRLDKKELSCIVATVGKVGLNIPNLDVVINAEGLEANTSTIQKMRSLTASSGKTCGIIIDFLDKGKYTQKHAISRLDQYKAIKGFVIKECKGLLPNE